MGRIKALLAAPFQRGVGGDEARRPRRCESHRRGRGRRRPDVASCPARCRDCCRRSPCLQVTRAAPIGAPPDMAAEGEGFSAGFSSAKAFVDDAAGRGVNCADWRSHPANGGADRSDHRGCGRSRRGRSPRGCSGTAVRPCPWSWLDGAGRRAAGSCNGGRDRQARDCRRL